MESILASEQANKAALLLVNERYNAQLAPFVKNSVKRLEHVSADIERIINEVCAETGADFEYVSARFNTHLASAVLVKDHAKREKLKVKKDWPKNVKEIVPTGDIKHTEVDDEGEVPGAGEDEARTPDARVDLKKDTQKWTCFRCDKEMDQRVAAVTPVCATCTAALLANCGHEDCECGDDCDCSTKEAGCNCKKKKMKGYSSDDDEALEKEADIYQTPTTIRHEDLGQLSAQPVNENLPFKCTICNRQGTQQEILEHVQRDHQDVLQQQQNSYALNPGVTSPVVSSKEAAPADIDEQAVVEPLSIAPGDQFDAMVQDLANRAAAIQFSTLEDKDLNALAQQLGLNAQDLTGKIQVIAVFDNYVGVNGELTNAVPEAPEGYQEVQAQQVRASAHEALIPTQIVINKVAEQMNMPEDLAYNMVKDKYGADLPDKYHAAVQGEYHFYVPASLANNTNDVAVEQGNIGPTVDAPSGGQLNQPVDRERAQF